VRTFSEDIQEKPLGKNLRGPIEGKVRVENNYTDENATYLQKSHRNITIVQRSFIGNCRRPSLRTDAAGGLPRRDREQGVIVILGICFCHSRHVADRRHTMARLATSFQE
jgi:hypothetical protein